MRVIVLGSGLLGVSSAYYLSRLGHEVTVLDRQASPAAETSFANGGQISVSHAEPWANPGAPLKVLKWLAREDAPLLFRLRADLRQWLWGLQFLRDHDFTYQGDFPMNTHGGQLSFGQTGTAGGMTQVIEAIHQIQGRAGQRQLARHDLAYVSGTGGVMSEQGALILRGA